MNWNTAILQNANLSEFWNAVLQPNDIYKKKSLYLGEVCKKMNLFMEITEKCILLGEIAYQNVHIN